MTKIAEGTNNSKKVGKDHILKYALVKVRKNFGKTVVIINKNRHFCVTFVYITV